MSFQFISPHIEQCFPFPRKAGNTGSERTQIQMDSRYYPGVEADVSKLMAELRNSFDQDYEVQTMHVSSTTCAASAQV